MRRNGNGWKTVSVTIDAVITDDRAPPGKQDKTKTFLPYEKKTPKRALNKRSIPVFDACAGERCDLNHNLVRIK